MKPILKRALSAAAAVGLGATLVPFLGVTPAGAEVGSQAAPTLTPDPVAAETTTFSLTDPDGQALCEGSAGQNYRVRTFIVNDGVNISTLQFNQGFPANEVGTDRDNSDASIASPLWKGGAPGTGYNPAGSPLGLINPGDLGGFSFSDPGWNLTDGLYQIGFACVLEAASNPNRNPETWWARTVQVDADATPLPFMFTPPAPSTPVIDSVNVDNGELIVDFTGTAADSWYAEATTVSGDYSSPVGTSTTVTDDTGPISITGLTNGTSYFVRVVALRAGFADTYSTESGPHIPQTNCGAVQSLTVTDTGTDDGSGPPGVPYIDVDWNAPAAVGGCPAPTSYQVTYSSGTASSPDPTPTGTGAFSARVVDVATNTPVTVTVIPIFDPGFVGTGANVQGIVQTGNVVIQEIDVTRPIGALVLTQVCGVNGELPAEGADAAAASYGGADNGVSNAPGTLDGYDLNTPPLGFDFGGALPLVPAVASSTIDQPTTGGTAPFLGPDGTLGQDGAIGQYPYPTDVDGNGGLAGGAVAAETYCGLDLGPAEFVTVGEGAGQYFSTSAAMNQVTIVDTRNVDAGWTVTGIMSDLTSGTDTFPGDFVGWTPVVTEDTSAFDHDAEPGTADYDMQVIPGSVIEPGSDDGLSAEFLTGTTTAGETLAQAGLGEGLGTAILDARIKLLIPVNADSGDYEGELTFSAV